MSVVIVGAGHAGGHLAQSLRKKGWMDSIIMIGDEAYPPYQRPPLSKQFLAGEIEADRVFLHGPDFFEKSRIDLLRGIRVESIDRERKSLQLSNGDRIPYARLALTTGARVRKLDLHGSALAGIFYLRGIDDVARIRERFRPGARLAIVGGGYIGLEVAAVAAAAGLHVTVVEMAERVMNRVAAPAVSSYFEALHRANGVEIVTGRRVLAFEGEEAVEAIATDVGTIPCDLAIVGVGVDPETTLAKVAGLDVEDGIVVDAFTCTSDPDIVAAGDCTRHPSGIYGRPIRLESVQNAVDQAAAAASTILGASVPYDPVPWFWSDQYDTKLQICGLVEGGEETVLRGDVEAGAFSVFHLREGTVVAVEAVNSPRDYMMGRRLIASRAQPPPAKIGDSRIPVTELA